MSINPYTDQISLLEASVYLPSSKVYIAHIRVLQAGLGIVLLLQLITLLFRYRNNCFWLFRKAAASSASDLRINPSSTTKFRYFWVPNSALLWTIFNTFFTIVLQGFLITLENYAIVGSNLNGIMLFRTLVFIPLFLSIWGISWSTVIASILGKSIGQIDSRSTFFSRNPLLINSFFLMIPILLLCTIIPFASILNSNFNHVFSTYQTLHVLLEQDSSSFDAGNTIDFTDSFTIGELAFSLIERSGKLIYEWQACFSIWAFFTGFCGLIYLFAAINHFRSIGNAMSAIRTNLTTAKSDYSIQMNHLVYFYRSLTANSVLVLVMTAGFFSLDVLLAAKTKEIARKGAMTEILLLVYLYLFLVFGGISTIFILIASIRGNNHLNAFQTHSVVPARSFRKPAALVFEQIQIQTVEVGNELDFITGDATESGRRKASVCAFEL